MFKVTVKPEIAKLRDNNTGTRNVLVGGRPDGEVLTFSRVPTYMESVPDEVKADDMLVIVEEIAPAEQTVVDETAAPEVVAVDETAPAPVEEVTETAAEPEAEPAPAPEPGPVPEPIKAPVKRGRKPGRKARK